jgi:hypothetical protein
MRLSKAARAGHTCGDCGHGVNAELLLDGMKEARPYRRCLRQPNYAGVVCTDAIRQAGDAACSRWKAEWRKR